MDSTMATAHDRANPTPISDVPWPKRTNKACCNCRRDKIKCDGERPCAACLRRGLSNDKCIDGCPPCRRARARCDGADPCARCLQSGIDCSDDPASPSMSLDEPTNRSSAASSIRSAPAARAKLACLACRRDNKKCDDNRPCMRCVSRMEECVHVDRIPKAVKHRCINCRKENRKCEDNRPCRHCVEMNQECIDAPRKGSGGQRVKMACANCRRNKVQCDPERPCRVCVRRGLECTIPSCTCIEAGLEPGTCSFCRSQRPKRDSQTTSDSVRSQTSEERQTVFSDTPPPSAGSNLSGYHGFDDMQGSAPGRPHSHSYDHHIPPQGHSFATDMHMSADAFSSAPYVQNYPSELTPPTNSFEYHTRLTNQEHPRRNLPMYYPHHDYPLFTTGETAFTDPGMTDANTGSINGGGLDKYLSRGLGMGSHAHPKDPSVHASFIPQYQPPSGASFSQSGHASGSGAAPAEFGDGVGVGFGTYAADGLTAFSDPTHSYGPVPMAMPISVAIPVPQQNVHSRRDVIAGNAGQMEMHPQLRRSANYLTSDSRTVQHGDKS